MKQITTLKGLLVAACVAGAGAVSAQSHSAHPLAFYGSSGNFYKDYVGTRLQVTNPSSIARDYAYTYAYPTWGGGVDTMTSAPLVDVPIVMGDGSSGNDSFACSALPAGSMDGKIAVVWRGPITGACEFGTKALNAQNAGALAVVIINEYAGEGPVGMAAGSVGASVTIPVFMVGNLDGIAISAAYRSSPAGTVKMTIVPWGKGLTNDLGFAPAGVSGWVDGAIPSYQLPSTAIPYKGLDGAFIANYGTADQTNVKLTSEVKFTPVESSTPATIHTNTLTLTPTTFATTDSIYALFGDEYDLSGMTGSGKGRFDIKYDISSDVADDFPGDNTFTHSFYTTDSTFSVGRYDMANDRPIATLWTGPGGSPAPTVYMWGAPFFVAKGGAAFKDIKFSVSSGPGAVTASETIFYVFKWVDGGPDASMLDSAIEGQELELLGTAIKQYDGSTDSSFEIFTTTPVTTDTFATGTGGMVKLEDNTWYFVAAEVSSITSTGMAFGCDGIVSDYPRSYGRHHFHDVTELYNPLFPSSKDDMRSSATSIFFNYFGGGGAVGNPWDVDSIYYANQIGLVPAISFKVTPYIPNAVKQVPLATRFEVFPNPTAHDLNVTLDLVNPAKKITYTILSAMGSLVSTETRQNVQNERYTYSTEKLAPGNYYIVINADGRQAFKKFTVVK